MKTLKLFVLFAFVMFLMSCSQGNKSNEEATEATDTEESAPQEVTATAVLSGASDSGVTGTAKFTQLDGEMVRMQIDVSNLTPGAHALHLHENGDCSAPDATSAGGHWNPTEHPHGKRGEGEFHKGDIINLEANAEGVVSWTQDIQGWTIGGAGVSNILNKAVIIHKGEDDFTSQPSGNAGARVACGVILADNPNQ